MNQIQTTPLAQDWLTPDHQAVLRTLARWVGAEEDGIDGPAAMPSLTTEKENGK